MSLQEVIYCTTERDEIGFCRMDVDLVLVKFLKYCANLRFDSGFHSSVDDREARALPC